MHLCVARINLGEFEPAQERLCLILAAMPADDPLRRHALSALAWVDLLLGNPALVAEADRVSAELIGLEPWEPSFQSTRGALLVETGHIEEGMRLLDRALAGADLPIQRSSVYCWMAI